MTPVVWRVPAGLLACKLPESCLSSDAVALGLLHGRGQQPINIRLSVMEVTRRGQNFTLRQLGICEPATRRGLAFCAEMGLPHRGYSVGAGSDADTENEVMSPEHAMRLWGRGVKTGRSSCLSSRSNSALTLTDTEHENKSDSENAVVAERLGGSGSMCINSRITVQHKLQWEKLQMTSSEKRKILCSVTFHIIAISCVVWSLYVLIDRTAEEIKQGKDNGILEWPFWTKLVVVAIGFTGGLVFMYVQCKVYVQLWRRLKAYNRVIFVQNCPDTSKNTEEKISSSNHNGNRDSVAVPVLQTESNTPRPGGGAVPEVAPV
ncbi:UNVERIFIED_CONTAM: hypothetical protein FKN15_033058 [Acipenser sinensis]